MSGYRPYGPMQVQRTQMLNGLKVAAAQHLGAQIAACTIMFQAGSRYEQDNQLGATHFIRAMSGSSGSAYTAYSKMRLLHQRGASITCTTDRQRVAFTLRCLPDDFPNLKYYLLDSAARCCFHEWEVNDVKPFVKDNLLRINSEQRVMDLLQTAIWGGPLGNSTFCEENRADGMLGEYLRGYVTENFRSDNCTVASVGVPYDETLKLAEKIEFWPDRSQCARETGCSFPRAGFEYYDLEQDSDTWIAVAVPGCGTFDYTSLLKYCTVTAACGVDDAQVGRHGLARVPHTPLGLMAEDVYTEFRAFNISYVDAGLFGILAKTRACSAGNVARSAVEFLSRVEELNTEQIEIELSLALHEEDCVKASEGLALQVANNVQIDNVNDLFNVVDCLCIDEILETAAEISSRKRCMAVAVVGDTAAVPHDKELFKDVQ